MVSVLRYSKPAKELFSKVVLLKDCSHSALNRRTAMCVICRVAGMTYFVPLPPNISTCSLIVSSLFFSNTSGQSALYECSSKIRQSLDSAKKQECPLSYLDLLLNFEIFSLASFFKQQLQVLNTATQCSFKFLQIGESAEWRGCLVLVLFIPHVFTYILKIQTILGFFDKSST